MRLRCVKRSSLDEQTFFVSPSGIVVDAFVARAADSQPPLDIVEAGLPATTAVMYLRGWCRCTALASRACGEILLPQFGISDLLLSAFLGYWIDA
jgi:hypothetical protein